MSLASPKAPRRLTSFDSTLREPAIAKVAAFRSAATERLSRRLGFGVAVICLADDAEACARRLSVTGHGALSPIEGGHAPFGSPDATLAEAGFELYPMDERWMGGRQLPPGVWIASGMLHVALAPGATVAAFTSAFSAGMEDLAFDRVAARPAEVAYRFRTGRPTVVGARYSVSLRNRSMPEMATDIYLFRPRGLKWIVSRAVDAKAIVGIRAALATSARGSPPRLQR